MLKLVDSQHPALRSKAKKVKKFDKKLETLISEMQKTLKAQKDPEGIGLAAPQIGKALQIFIIDYEGTEKIIINPKIIKIANLGKIKAKKEEKNLLEGCLSIPYYYGPVERKNFIEISYQNEKGEEITEKFEGFMAHIVQHEIDHLNGILFVDHIISQNKKLYLDNNGEWEEIELK